MKRMSDFIEAPLVDEIKERMNVHAELYSFSWGLCSYREKYEVLGLPISGETARKLMKGYYVGKSTCIKLLEFFDMPYTHNRKYLERVLEGEDGL